MDAGPLIARLCSDCKGSDYKRDHWSLEHIDGCWLAYYIILSIYIIIYCIPYLYILLVQNSVEVGETGAGMTTAAAGTCKESLNRRWGCSDKTLRRSSQFSVSTRMEHSNGEFCRVFR